MALELEGLSKECWNSCRWSSYSANSLLTDFTPLFLDSDKGTVASQFDMGDVESAGLVEFDFLGLKTLTIIDQSVRRINAKAKSERDHINIDNLSLKDSETFELLQRGETTGILQLESRRYEGTT